MGDARPLTQRKAVQRDMLVPAEAEGRPAAKTTKATKAKARPKVVAPPPSPPARPSPAGPRMDKSATPGLDRRTAERLRRGRLTVDGRIDLHGLSAVRAEAALGRFLGQAWTDDKRCVLVITGKGRAGSADTTGAGRITLNPGVLRAGLPVWLRRPPNDERVLSWAVARPEHGGTGAFYVLLRRQRS